VLSLTAFLGVRAFSLVQYVPYDSKASTGFCGIMNQGATWSGNTNDTSSHSRAPNSPRTPLTLVAVGPRFMCLSQFFFLSSYMNSMLQALYLLPKFREVVYQIPSDADDRGAKIGFALQRVFYALQTGSRGVSTKQLTSSFGWGSIENFVQHDVQEVSDDMRSSKGNMAATEIAAGDGRFGRLAQRIAAQVRPLILRFFFFFFLLPLLLHCARTVLFSSAAFFLTLWTRRRRRRRWPA
jgi:hypothetical protein